jgi:hypothetical protein
LKRPSAAAGFRGRARELARAAAKAGGRASLSSILRPTVPAEEGLAAAIHAMSTSAQIAAVTM